MSEISDVLTPLLEARKVLTDALANLSDQYRFKNDVIKRCQEQIDSIDSRVDVILESMTEK